MSAGTNIECRERFKGNPRARRVPVASPTRHSWRWWRALATAGALSARNENGNEKKINSAAKNRGSFAWVHA